jgi:hypothetical protein
MGPRSVSRLFLPCLYGRPEKKVPQHLLKQLANAAILPALLHAVPTHASHLPTSHDHEFTRAQGSRSGLHFSTRSVGPAHIRAFEERFFQLLDCIPDFQHAFIMHEIRGIKGYIPHQADGENERQAALDFVFSPIDFDHPLHNINDWHVDIALEISLKGHVNSWLVNNAPHVLSWALDIPFQRAQALTSRGRFCQDLAAHLELLGGYRLEISPDNNPYGAVHLQAYVTEKEIHYQLHEDGIFRRRTPRDLLPKNIDKFRMDIKKVSNILASCEAGVEVEDVSGNEDDEDDIVQVVKSQEGAARIELRVPLRSALQVLQEMPADLLERATLAVPSPTWWYVFHNCL